MKRGEKGKVTEAWFKIKRAEEGVEYSMGFWVKREKQSKYSLTCSLSCLASHHQTPSPLSTLIIMILSPSRLSTVTITTVIRIVIPRDLLHVKWKETIKIRCRIVTFFVYVARMVMLSFLFLSILNKLQEYITRWRKIRKRKDKHEERKKEGWKRQRVSQFTSYLRCSKRSTNFTPLKTHWDDCRKTKKKEKKGVRKRYKNTTWYVQSVKYPLFMQETCLSFLPVSSSAWKREGHGLQYLLLRCREFPGQTLSWQPASQFNMSHASLSQTQQNTSLNSNSEGSDTIRKNHFH